MLSSSTLAPDLPPSSVTHSPPRLRQLLPLLCPARLSLCLDLRAPWPGHLASLHRGTQIDHTSDPRSTTGPAAEPPPRTPQAS
eukprot:3503608-Rhodomonas_salina.2